MNCQTSLHTPLYSVQVSLLRQAAFCPRVPYFLDVARVPAASPKWVSIGRDYHLRQERLSRDRSFRRFGLLDARRYFNLYFSSESLGLHGIADLVLETESAVIPVEFKLNAARPSRGQLLQLAAYGMLAEERFGKPFNDGFFLFERSAKTSRIAGLSQYREKVIAAVHRLRHVMNTGVIPDSSATAAQCSQCEFLVYCNDRF